ncbi:hypothetical protein Hs30E_18250 [Lactococcus hodotermopsidis]|uniref:Regulator of chromosome segregation-like C-terminal domain-containing protein n=1 Tax=Pseudolactococcus hodotermopsidis TaxID=2709157 RepID=A0A6A0BFL5_9LACT|nr:DUF536 domain-containing protein [Lactococcus hodotermopsidis]GFH43274.1 hypothetical protein Hs30E_18250 [Lactococcus hodotermopsidis]
MKNMTVTELSEAFGVTRQAMNARVKKLDEGFLDKNDRGVTVVNEEGIRALEKHYEKAILAEDDEVVEFLVEKVPEAIDFDRILSDLMLDKNAEIVRLVEQIAIKDLQIAEKDKQLDQQQQLTAKALTEREQTLLELENEKSKSFFKRLFNR